MKVLRFFKKPKNFEKKIKNIIGVRPNDVFLYQLALIHKSVVNDEKHEAEESNERLEFLGDAVIGMVVAEFLYSKFGKKNEGELTKLRSKIVSRATLNDLAVKIGLDQLVQAKLDKNSIPNSIYGNAFEALVGAIYLDLGLKASKKFLLKKVLNEHVDVLEILNKDFNYKSKVIEWAQGGKREYVFEVIQEHGEGIEKIFEAVLKIDGKTVASGSSRSKKKAEQEAAKVFCLEMKL